MVLFSLPNILALILAFVHKFIHNQPWEPWPSKFNIILQTHKNHNMSELIDHMERTSTCVPMINHVEQM